jgi:hypothetical protein
MKNVSQVVTYYAWDTSANSYKTGDSANHTLRGMQDTTEFTPAASPSEVDSTNLKGAYKVSIAATENIGNLMLLGGVSSTANIVLFPARWSNDPIPGVVRSGVAQAGAASTITLDASASATDNTYNRNQVAIIAGTGIGQGGRIITGYVGSTKVATVTPSWTTNPDSTSVFALIPAGVDVETWLATAVTAASAGVPDVNAKNLGGTSQTGRDIGASVLLSAGSGAGQLDFTSGVVKANLAQILGTALTETAGQIAAAFKKFFNIATPAATMDHLVLVDTVTTATTATNLTNAPTAGDFTATMKTSIGTAVAASAVASVTAGVTLAAGAITDTAIAAGSGLKAIRSNTAQAGAGTTITLDAGASASNNFYNNALILLTGGTGAGQARFITAYVGASKVATVATWTTNPDNTTTFVILPFDAVAGASAPTAAQNATAVWTDLLAGSDFSTASSVGKLLKDDIDAAISSRLASGSYTAPDNASITAIKTTTDQIRFTVANKVDSTIQLASDFAQGAADKVWSTVARTLTAFGFNVTVGTNNDKTGYGLSTGERNSIADAYLDRADAVETGITPRQAARLGVAADSGKVDGMGTTTVHVRDAADTKNRVTATVDSVGNRTNITRDLT